MIALYLFNLNGVGVLGPDEPRYAAIGRAMAQTDDFVTPRLWGSPWFEKPPLLYWMTALGAFAGLGPDLCGRLPVAILSLIFLGFFFVSVRNEFGWDSAAVATFCLATSAGWLAFSNLCLTDLPLAVFFAASVLLALPLLRAEARTQKLRMRFFCIGASLGAATLAKGLVPIALCVPMLWFLRCFWRDWWTAAAGCLLVAGPWYIAVYRANGYAFFQEFFLKHHLERLYSNALQHIQPPYYYLPVLLVAVFPWTPLLLLLRKESWDRRLQFLAAIVLFGLLFFSISRNKLPGYLLPLLPALFLMLGAVFQKHRVIALPRGYLIACALLVTSLPFAATLLPASLSAGKFTLAALSAPSRTELFYILLPLAVVVLARRQWKAPLLVLTVVTAGIYVKQIAFPALDQQVSARSMWRRLKHERALICDGGTNRDWLFGLTYYRGEAYPPCDSGNFDYALRSHFKNYATLEKLK